ncbi:MarR family winged helix-turn-helix transcriptional regulator [Nonomuraea angiospora]|uniref:DNA-binding MarR family transcriptional regulator n=1 Tax=Nonomuraea angiospora TaxID=46172 RepID=A0ABR9LQ40_9ACTN|nr:MarR family winged helix-turn-helix transcriptional regulator [Nonomuraea angiospora]MBE1582774.1 DNA-binding MarR family transcriptional regulator [Nonomuraea angiospora]MDX3108831.1 MarR family winged helix-turn-helix transcriptional regulator [Nonomuraea angiospora]
MDTPEGPPPQRLRTLPSRLTNQAAQTANRFVDQALGQAGVRRYHYALLAALEEYGPASQAALGRRTGIDRSDMVATVNDLAERRLLERAPDPDDRRRNIITITAAGRSQLTDLDRLLAAAQDEFLAPLPAADRRNLIDLLTRLVTHHGDKHA